MIVTALLWFKHWRKMNTLVALIFIAVLLYSVYQLFLAYMSESAMIPANLEDAFHRSGNWPAGQKPLLRVSDPRLVRRPSLNVNSNASSSVILATCVRRRTRAMTVEDACQADMYLLWPVWQAPARLVPG